MCGICGVVGSNDARLMVEKMNPTLAHRGPDGAGVWEGKGVSLGHRRLSVLDLSDAGRQPWVEGNLSMVFNGEIMNFRALRGELTGPFCSDCDTEVLLRLFRKDGWSCLDRLRGFFAFGIWDATRQRLLAARDPLGIKPFFYRQLDGGGLAFASEIKALVELGRPEIDRSGLRDYFSYKRVPAPKSIYQGIYQLPAGHLLEWEGGPPTIRRYWNPPLDSTLHDLEAATDRLEELLRRIVPLHSVADVPLGLFLSGGIDSATLLAHLDRPKTFTLGQDVRHRSEHQAARAIAAHFGSDHHEEIARLGGLEEALQTLPTVFDEPFGDSAAWSVYLVSQMARRGVTVALSGEGGDELFYGYDRYSKWFEDRASGVEQWLSRVRRPFARGARSAQRRASEGIERYANFLSPFTMTQKHALLHPDLLAEDYDDLWRLRPYWREDFDPMRRLQWLDLNCELPEVLLTKVDRASMAHSLEVRPPLLDQDLVEFALSLDPALNRVASEHRGKKLIRRSMEPRLPAGWFDRPKRGFNLPIRTWLAASPGRLRFALDRLDRAEVTRPLVRPKLSNEQSWMVLILDSWMEHAGAYR